MMIHDFDMARFLAGSEVTEVNAVGSVLVDPGIGEAGDVDTAVVTLKFENGAIGVIDNSRKAVYGYDQRVEVFGSEGCAEDQNDTPNTAVLSTADGAVHGVAYKVMWDRYTLSLIHISIKSLVMNGLGVSFFYAPVVQQELANGTLARFNLAGVPMRGAFYFVCLKDNLFAQSWTDWMQ